MVDESVAAIGVALHRALVRKLLRLVMDEEMNNAQVLNVARQWLKDNAITGDPERPDAAALDLQRALAELDLELPN